MSALAFRMGFLVDNYEAKEKYIDKLCDKNAEQVSEMRDIIEEYEYQTTMLRTEILQLKLRCEDLQEKLDIALDIQE